MKRTSYKQYSHEIKQAISRSGDVNLYPNLKIPKSTSYHWIRHGVRKLDHGNEEKERVSLGDVKDFIEAVSGAIDFELLREQDVNKIRGVLIKCGSNELSWLPERFHKRLLRKVNPCRASNTGLCLKTYPGQLTSKEILQMKKMVYAKEYAHMSIVSLALLAKREGKVMCSHHTWYKYITKNKWKRYESKVVRRRVRYSGLKAKHPHEYWHQDVTKIPLADGSIRCLQVIQDNCSRSILGWNLSDTVTAKDSGKLLMKVKGAIGKDIRGSVHLVVDRGGENLGQDAQKHYKIGYPKVLRRVARKEIKHANTMVEVFFKELKSNFLKFQDLRDSKDLLEAVCFYIDQHNRIIPKMALGGLTPEEVLNGGSAVYNKILYDQLKTELSTRRVLMNLNNLCKKCWL